MADKLTNIGLIYIGKELRVQIGPVKNEGGVTLNDVKITVTVPDDLEFVEANVPKGAYDPIKSVWSMNTLLAGESVVGELVFTIMTDCETSFTFTSRADSADSCESCIENNTHCSVFEGIPCCDVPQCQAKDCGATGGAPGKVVTSNYVLVSTDRIILVDNTSGDLTVTGDPSNFYDTTNLCGTLLRIKVIGEKPDTGNGVTFTSVNGKIIDNTSITGAGTNYTFASLGESITLWSDGSHFYLL